MTLGAPTMAEARGPRLSFTTATATSRSTHAELIIKVGPCLDSPVAGLATAAAPNGLKAASLDPLLEPAVKTIDPAPRRAKPGDSASLTAPTGGFDGSHLEPAVKTIDPAPRRAKPGDS